MSNVSAADRQAEAKALRAMGLILPGDASSIGRRPLGLAVLDGPEDAPERDLPTSKGELQARDLVMSSVSLLSDEALDAPISWRDAFENILGVALAGIFDGDDAVHKGVVQLRERVSELETMRRTETAEQKAVIAVRSELSQMKSIQEAARVASRGEAGIQGPRGIPGPPGPSGPAGQRGDAGPRPAGFITNPDDFSAVLQMSDGLPGPTLRLRSLFEVYDSQAGGE